MLNIFGSVEHEPFPLQYLSEYIYIYIYHSCINWLKKIGFEKKTSKDYLWTFDKPVFLFTKTTCQLRSLFLEWMLGHRSPAKNKTQQENIENIGTSGWHRRPASSQSISQEMPGDPWYPRWLSPTWMVGCREFLGTTKNSSKTRLALGFQCSVWLVLVRFCTSKKTHSRKNHQVLAILVCDSPLPIKRLPVRSSKHHLLLGKLSISVPPYRRFWWQRAVG